MSGRFIGIDWGTTHRRATLLDAQGQVLAQRSDADGTLACAGRFQASLAALAGLITTARLTSAVPQAGNQFELDAIAACFIGGASASGGVGRVMGAVIGAFIMGVMNNGMSILGIGIDYQQVIKGLVLLAAVFIDVYNKNK